MFRLPLLALLVASVCRADSITDQLAELKNLRAALVVNDVPTPTPEIKATNPYEWRGPLPKGQYALMEKIDGEWVQIGAYNPATKQFHRYDGRTSQWGKSETPPIAPPKVNLAKEVKPPALPFRSWPLASAGEAADADLSTSGRWPEGLAKIPNLKRYQRASMTQSISILNDRDRIEPVHRLANKGKYHQSGGLEGIDGWRSDLYQNDLKPKVWVESIQVLNHLGYYQPNRGWVRSYPDGKVFVDVLSTSRGVFEIRKLEKKSGKWNPLVVYRNKDARPEGYSGLKDGMTCAGCHFNDTEGPGKGGYGVGLTVGGDGIFSDPFVSLE